MSALAPPAPHLDAADVLEHRLKALAVATQIVVLVLLVEQAGAQRLKATAAQVGESAIDPGCVLLSTPVGRSSPTRQGVAGLAVELFEPSPDGRDELHRAHGG